MNTLTKEIDGISCEIQTVDGYTDVNIAQGNTKLLPEWIVRKAPEAIAEQIASIVIQHLLLTPELPDEVWEQEIIKGDNGNESRHTTPEGDTWLEESRSVSHDTEGDDEVLHAVINFRIGHKIAFQLAYRTVLE
jgi:hypothetical protein